MGQTVGQPLGGLLSHPERNIPFFDVPFWHKYPFALPFFVASLFATFAVVMGYFSLEEVDITDLTSSFRLPTHFLFCRLLRQSEWGMVNLPMKGRHVRVDLRHPMFCNSRRELDHRNMRSDPS